MSKVATRFAPSPTGPLHIGGVRTALFNWLFSKNQNGHFYLRIEDTDVKRSNDQITKNIIRDLKWLQLNWDGDIVHQKENIHLHQEIINNLLRSGHAYHCYCTEKEINDALEDKQVRDMTKSQLVKGAFRMLTLKLGQANIPMIVTNHTYDVIGAYVPTKEMGGGSGLKYASSTIIYLTKKKEKDGKDVIGNLIKAKTAKSRLSKRIKM